MRTKFILIFLLLASALSAQTSINVTLLRGDSKTLTYVTNGDYSSDAVHFTVKKDINLTSSRVIDRIASSAYDGTKTTFTIALVKMDTWGLTPGNYVYDIEADSPTDTTFSRTLFRGIFTIVGDVRTPYDNTNLTLNSAVRYIPYLPDNFVNNDIIQMRDGSFIGVQPKSLVDSSFYSKTQIDALLSPKFNTSDYDSYFDSRLGVKTTDNLTQGSTNKYYSSSLFSSDFSLKTTDNLTEGTNNKYFTSARVALIIGDSLNTFTKNRIGLGNVDNTSDLNKPVSSATQTALNAKQDLIGYTPARLDSVYYKSSLYTKTEINSLLSGKQNTISYTTANADSVYKKSETYNRTEVDAAISGSSADSSIFATHNWVYNQGYLTGSSSLNPANISQSTSYRFVTDAEKTTWNGKQDAYTNLSTIGNLANSAGWLHNDGAGTYAYSTPTKSDIGLSNVENTALSTWAGSTNLTTAGNLSVSSLTSTNEVLINTTTATGGNTKLTVNGAASFSSTNTISIINDASTNDIRFKSTKEWTIGTAKLGVSNPEDAFYINRYNGSIWQTILSINNAGNATFAGSVQATTIKLTNVPVYADNTEALAGGLVAGQIYRTADGTLKITY